MEQSLSLGCFAQGRKYFYSEFLEFTRRYPEVKICLYVPENDFPLLAKKECSSIVGDLLDLCDSGRLTLVGMMSRSHPLDYLRKISKGQSNPILSYDALSSKKSRGRLHDEEERSRHSQTFDLL